ncbi:hypothetical protein HispidOSU_004856, partial [Sigmodon hispidus]
GPRQPRGLSRHSKHVAPLEKTTFLQGKKIKPHSKHLPQMLCPESCREQIPAEELKPTPSGQDKSEVMAASKEKEAVRENTFLEEQARVSDQDLRPAAKPRLLHRRKMQALAALGKSPEQEDYAVNTREKIQLSSQDKKQVAAQGRGLGPHNPGETSRS